jgi:GTPase SAR1 family protein
MEPRKEIFAERPIRLKCLVLGSSGAGKTKFNRRYFHGTYEEDRKSTMCADFYSSIIPNPLYVPIKEKDGDTFSKKKSKSKKKKKQKKKTAKKAAMTTSSSEGTRSKPASQTTPLHLQAQSYPLQDLSILHNPSVALQMWDTAGKERLLSESAGGLTSRLGDAFFRHANVAILIYDATSSRSFLQLIMWHKELLERIMRIQANGFGNVNERQLEHESNYCAEYHRTTFPVLVVATKLDRLKAEQSKSGNIRTVAQRSVLGLGRSYKGIDYYYEYGVVDGVEVQPRVNKSHSFDKNETGNDESSNGRYGAMQENISSMFGLEGDWNSDTSYLNFVRLSEDECFPDREMVKRWCRRQGLLHIEVSALENKGVNEAVEAAVTIALKEKQEQKKIKAAVTIALKEKQEQKKVTDAIERGMHGSLHTNRDPLNGNSGHESNDKPINDQNDECHFCRFLIPQSLRRTHT